jgi:glycosyltransferase involved in cell wall biosynthesis
MKNRTVTIDASGLQPAGRSGVSGISRTTQELVGALLAMPELPFTMSVFSQRLGWQRLQAYRFGCRQRHLWLPRRREIAWLTQRLPVIESLCQCDLFHAPANYAPVHRLERTVATIHDAMYFSHPESHLGHGLEQKRIPPFARGVRAILTPSLHSKQDIVRFMDVDPAKVVVAPWGVNHNHFKPTNDKEAVASRLQSRFGLQKSFFLSVSCDLGRKNSPRVLRQYLRLASQEPANDLVMVWRNPPDFVRQILAESPARNRVHLIDQVSEEELRDLYCTASSLFFPSFYEGFGLPVLEAMACGAPVVTAKNSSLMEVGGEAVIYVDPSDDNAVYSAFELFENNQAIGLEWSQKGLKQARQFTWDRCASETVGVYRRCLAEME